MVVNGITYLGASKALTEAKSTKDCLQMDVRKCPNESAWRAHDGHWQGEAVAHWAIKSIGA